MYVQLNAAIVDADATNRQELANFLATFGVHLSAQFANCDPLTSLLGRSDAPQLVIVNLDPGAHDNLRKISTLPRQFPNTSFFVMSTALDPEVLMERSEEHTSELQS